MFWSFVSVLLGTALEVLVDVVPRLDDYKDHVDLNFDCEVRILVHQSQVGSIIGRAGGKIKELRDITGTNIRVYSQCCPMSTDRVIQITGTNYLIANVRRKNHFLAKYFWVRVSNEETKRGP